MTLVLRDASLSFRLDRSLTKPFRASLDNAVQVFSQISRLTIGGCVFYLFWIGVSEVAVSVQRVFTCCQIDITRRLAAVLPPCN